jgi:hypothetical protein
VVADGQLPAAQAHLDRPAGRPEFGGVVEQVLDRDAQPLGAAVDRALLDVGAEPRVRPVTPCGFQRGRRHLIHPNGSMRLVRVLSSR